MPLHSLSTSVANILLSITFFLPQALISLICSANKLIFLLQLNTGTPLTDSSHLFAIVYMPSHLATPWYEAKQIK